MSALSVIIPTVNYRSSLDIAIKSALDNIHQDLIVVVSVNNWSLEPFSSSPFFKNTKVAWFCTSSSPVPIWESFNLSVHKTCSAWIFMLSDDDQVLPGFLDGVNLNQCNDDFLYATKTIVSDGANSYQSVAPSQELLDSVPHLDLFFLRNAFHNHVSLFLFSRNSYNRIGGFRRPGYPNGYFFDTIFHAHLLANSNKIVVSKDPVFMRFESLNQASALFFLDSRVNQYMAAVVEGFWSEPRCRAYCKMQYSTKNKHLKDLLYYRFKTEFHKLNKSTYRPRLLAYKLCFKV